MIFLISMIILIFYHEALSQKANSASN